MESSAARLRAGHAVRLQAAVEKAGTQGIELLMWLAARAALGERVSAVHRNYHIPISNTASGLMVMTPAA